MQEHAQLALGRVIAHRGASGSAPENTLAAVRKAAELGCTWVEVDVMVTADQQAVVHHDDELDRCTNGHGAVLAKRYSEIAALDAGSWFAPQFVGQRVPTLEQLVDAVLELGLGLNLEIKPTSGWEVPTSEIIMRTLEKIWPAQAPLLISSFSLEALRVARNHAPATPRGYVTDAIPPDWRQRLASAECVSLHCHYHKLLTRELAHEIKGEGMHLLCFTVNSLQDARRLLDWGVDALFSDFPERLIPSLSA